MIQGYRTNLLSTVSMDGIHYGFGTVTAFSGPGLRYFIETSVAGVRSKLRIIILTGAILCISRMSKKKVDFRKKTLFGRGSWFSKFDAKTTHVG
jgi:hypothetical protein